jgi:hypothetical protein
LTVGAGYLIYSFIVEYLGEPAPTVNGPVSGCYKKARDLSP